MTDKEYVKELKNFTTEKLITQMEYFGVDPYYTEVWWPTLKEIERRLKIAEEALEREIEYGQMVVDFTKGETMKSDEWKYDTTCDAESATTTEVDYCNNCPYLPWGKDCISRQQAAWIEVIITTDSGTAPVKDWWYCSLCDCHVGYKHNYCPNCGAKMGGDTE